MSAASDNLRSNQRQLDMDGCEVGVSRQAVDETLEQYDAMRAALKEAEFFFSDDFPRGPDGDSIATPRYREAYRAILAALNAQ